MADDIYSRVVVADKNWIIRKFDARTGLKLARLIMAKAQPLLPLLAANVGGDVKNASDRNVYGAVFAILGELTDEDIDALVDKCLRVCYADLPAGTQPVIDAMGHYGVDGVEYDLGLTLSLCYEAIKWGASDFFGESSSISSLVRKSNG